MRDLDVIERKDPGVSEHQRQQREGEAMRRFGWPVLPWVLVIGIAVAVGVSTVRFPAFAIAIQTGALVATFLAAALYTLETRSLRLQQRRIEEIRLYPWLALGGFEMIANREIEAFGDDFIIQFRVENRGLTPALRLRVWATFKAKAGQLADQTFDELVAALVPSDSFTVRFPVEDPAPADCLLDAFLSYETVDGGQGRISCTYDVQGRNSFRLTSSSHNVVLSTGAPLSGQTDSDTSQSA